MEWVHHRWLAKFKPNVDECVKAKVKVNFTVEQATKAHWGSRGIALLFI